MSWSLKDKEELTRGRDEGRASQAEGTAGAKAPRKVWLDHRVELGPGSWVPGRASLPGLPDCLGPSAAAGGWLARRRPDQSCTHPAVSAASGSPRASTACGPPASSLPPCQILFLQRGPKGPWLCFPFLSGALASSWQNRTCSPGPHGVDPSLPLRRGLLTLFL